MMPVTTLSEKLLERMGGRDAIHPSSKIARILRAGGPSKSSEFRRIHNLPRRDWEEADDLLELTTLATEAFRKPDGEMTLWPVQAAALRDAHDQGGLFAPIAVGKGKALISILVAVVMKANRPLLIVPAALRDQTLNQVLPEMKQHWVLPSLVIRSYSELSLAKNATFLEDMEPDLIICDEVHNFRNRSAGRTRRVDRYMTAKPDTAFVALSGTVTNRSIKDYAHILRWCLKGNTPLPDTWAEVCSWADALDGGIKEKDRAPPGALAIWTDDGRNVRQGFRDRLTQTPGVIATKATELGVSLRILNRRLSVPSEIAMMLAKMSLTWETPNGDWITEAVDLWRHARELACGFWYKWSPAPPRVWLDARKEWKRYVRDTLKHNRRRLDTELQVWNECLAVFEGKKKVPSCRLPAWEAWARVKDSFKPNTVAVWESDFAINDATAWLKEHRGIVWTEHSAFGERLSKVSGAPYFGPGDKVAAAIRVCKDPCIASIRAHGEGKNLQHNHSRNLIASPPASGKTWEQLLGRTHREGQKADEVLAWVNLHTDELEAAFRQAMKDAQYLEHTLGSRQKLLYADMDFEV